MKVEELTTSPAVVVRPDTPLRDVAALLTARHISGVPVVNEVGRVVGVVSESDIVKKEAAIAPPRRRWRRNPRVSDVVTAADAMTSPPVLVEAWMSDQYAAWLMTTHDVNRLPVLRHGHLVGVIARADLVREFARSDADIAREVRERVLRPFGLEELDVFVEHGRVRVVGELAHGEVDASELRDAVERVPGVVGVELRVVVRRPVSSAV